MKQGKILVVDDEPEMLENLDRLLSSEGYDCTTLQDSMRFRDVLGEVRPDVLISDLRMPGADGMTVLAAAKADDPSLPVILITAYATVSSAVEAIQEGAFDYVAKPFTADELFVVVGRAMRFRRLVVENESLKEQVGGGGRSAIVGSSPAFVKLLDQVHRVGATEANVLITGESGTGKELIAQELHECSPRKDHPFIPVDCAALPEGLLESELFGHEKGSFTGAVARRSGLLMEADRGTVFLDEIGELTLPLQAKLLRTLEQGQIRPVGGSKFTEVDIRVLAATNRDLAAAVVEGTFREDLYYRLNVVHLTLPPLRSRREDIPLLVRRFMDQVCGDRSPPEISPEAWEVLEAYEWPGNVRQLKNLVERVVALDTDGKVGPSDLPPEIRFGTERTPRPARAATGAESSDLPLDYAEAKDQALRSFHARYLEGLLAAHDGNISKAAEAANVSRRTLHRWLADIKTEKEDDEATVGDVD